LDGTTTNSSELSKVIGTGVFSDVLATSDPTATGEFTPGSTLQGTITYQYTPVPEPATWAMMGDVPGNVEKEGAALLALSL